jgi:hypothetical protein
VIGKYGPVLLDRLEIKLRRFVWSVIKLQVFRKPCEIECETHLWCENGCHYISLGKDDHRCHRCTCACPDCGLIDGGWIELDYLTWDQLEEFQTVVLMRE